jgi:hypothetical protein
MVDAFETSGSSPPPLPDDLVEPLAEILAEAVVEYLRRKYASAQHVPPGLSVPPGEATVERAA